MRLMNIMKVKILKQIKENKNKEEREMQMVSSFIAMWDYLRKWISASID